MSTNHALQAIDLAIAELRSLLHQKNTAYGNSAFEPAGVLCKADAETLLRARADDKIRRIQNGDTSEDAPLDLAGYIILLRAIPHYRRIKEDAINQGDIVKEQNTTTIQRAYTALVTAAERCAVRAADLVVSSEPGSVDAAVVLLSAAGNAFEKALLLSREERERTTDPTPKEPS